MNDTNQKCYFKYSKKQVILQAWRKVVARQIRIIQAIYKIKLLQSQKAFNKINKFQQQKKYQTKIKNISDKIEKHCILNKLKRSLNKLKYSGYKIV